MKLHDKVWVAGMVALVGMPGVALAFLSAVAFSISAYLQFKE